MASAALENLSPTPDPFPDCCPSYGWLSPRISFSFDLIDDDDDDDDKDIPPNPMVTAPPRRTGPGSDFEFRPEDPASLILPADELISDGKLVPLQFAPPRLPSDETPSPAPDPSMTAADPYALSPKAPRCSTRLKEFLCLRKSAASKALEPQVKTVTASNSMTLKRFLRRGSKSVGSVESSSFPLLHESESRPSHSSSSSSCHELEDIPRLSLDSEKPPKPRVPKIARDPTMPLPDHPPVRMGRSAIRNAVPARGVSVDSPRMNPSGRIVFQSLERSSSSPSSFNGGPRPKLRSMERSYSANVRVSPVLNVFSFAPLFSTPKKEVSVARSRRRSIGGKSDVA